MKTRLIIAIGSLILGGTATAASVAMNVNPLMPASQTSPQVTVQPAQKEDLPQSAKDANTAATQATATQNASDETASITPSVPVNNPAPKPTPKPATVYADQPSAATPCRLPDQNVYTNDCSGTVRQPDPAPAPVDANPAPADNSGTVVSNPNQ